MPNSDAHKTQLECPDCGQTFDAEIWQIVDTAERPDLVEKIREGTLHTIPCTNCDHVGAVDVPLLLYRPEEEPHIFFSPAQGTSQEEDQQQAAKLIGRLRDTLGPAWQDHWLEEGLPGVQRQVLPAALSDDPEAALQEMADRQAEEMERLRSEAPEQYLQMALSAFLQADNLEQKRQILKQTPELLDESTDEMLRAMIRIAKEQGDEEAQQVFSAHHALLNRCREIGVEVAFEEIASSDEEVPAEMDDFMQALSNLPKDQRDEIMRVFSQADSPEEFMALLEQHPDLLEKLESVTQQVEEDAGTNYPSRILTEAGPMGEVLLESLNVQSAEELKIILQQHPELYAEEGLQLLAELLLVETRSQAQQLLRARQALYQRCQGVGVEVAFEEMLQASSGVPEELQVILQELSQSARRRDMPRRVKLCQKALTMVTRETRPELWGALQNTLANSLAQNPLGERAENIEQAIFHYQQALEVRTRQADPERWAATQNNLANAYFDRIRGERAENIEQAIFHYQQALEVRTRQADPERWAATQNNLAVAYFDRIRGERAENIEQAIFHYQQALEVYTRQADPERWAATQNNLAVAYFDRIRGERAENIEQAIFHYQQALEVYTRQADPERWAATQNNLANAYSDRIRGERAENIEQAIFHYQQALEVRTRQAYPEEWAQTVNNLANAYSDRIRGERAENIEQAIFHYQQALEVYTRQADPERWAATQNNLANAYSDRIRGERAENIEQAIFHYQQALEVRTRQAYPEDWAMTQNNLATAYSDRIRGERAENIEQAIFHYQQALEVRTRQADPERWAATQNNLANAYSDRIRGERAENIEQAIARYQQALEVRTRQAYPEDWAMTQNNLANAYRSRIRGERAENIEQAIARYQQALEVYTRQADPERWAATQNNLATAYSYRTPLLAEGERAENIEQAIFHYQQALEVYTRQAYPEDWAMTQNNLANAYADRTPLLAEGERAENIEQAIARYQQALEVYTRQADPERWAATQNNLAVAYADRTPLLAEGERAENIEQAIFHYQQALEVYTRQAYPDKCRGTSRRVGNLGFENWKWPVAIEGYTQALDAQDVLMRTTTVRSSKTLEIKKVQNLPVRAAYAYVQLEEPHRAVEVLENGRARLLAESLEQNRRDLERLPDLGFKAIYEDYTETLENYTDLLALADDEQRPKDWQMQIEAAQDKLHQIEESIRDEVGAEHAAFAYFMDDIPFEVIQAQAAETPLVYMLATSHGGMALIVNGKSVQAYELPELRQELLQNKIWNLSNTESLRIQDHIQAGKITSEDIRDARGGYLSIYRLWRFLPYLVNTPPVLKVQLDLAWQQTLDKACSWIWDVVMEPILSALDSQKDVILIPTGSLSLLPLHAAWTPDDSYPTGRRYAFDEIGFSYTPSARALISARRQAPHRQLETLMAVDNPDGSLVFSEPEVKAALSYFDDEKRRHLANDQATEDNVRQAMTAYDVLHFSTHGKADFEQPLQSGLLMANDDTLSLEEFFKLRFEQARLAILSACETGLPSDLSMLDEVVSLPSGLLQAGVPGVIGSLWAVNDMSTAMLMAQFYEYWRVDGLSPQEALRQAQIWLRDSTTDDKKERFKDFVDSQAARMGTETAKTFYNKIGWDDDEARVFKSPVYWAAFTYTGV